MLRPDMIIQHAKERADKRLTDFNQLIDGLNIGGRIIVGGDNRTSMRLRSLAMQAHRMGQIMAISEVTEQRLDPFVTHTFDEIAIAQMLMAAKNEAFHDTIDKCIAFIQENVVDGEEPLVVGLQLLREMANQVPRL